MILAWSTLLYKWKIMLDLYHETQFSLRFELSKGASVIDVRPTRIVELLNVLSISEWMSHVELS